METVDQHPKEGLGRGETHIQRGSLTVQGLAWEGEVTLKGLERKVASVFALASLWGYQA